MKTNITQKNKTIPKKIPKKRGPKLVYNQRMDKIAYQQAYKGKTYKEIYEILGVTEPTGIRWKRLYKTFREALIQGRKDLRNRLVERSLYELCVGFEHSTQKALVVSDGKDMGAHVEKVKVKEYFPPQINAIKYMLNNRKSISKYGEDDGWSDKQTVEHTGTLNYKVTPDNALEPEEVKE